MRIVCYIAVLFTLPLFGQAEAVPRDFSITLERTGCIGLCPDYKITILANGSVQYEGRWYVGTKGIRKSTISKSDVEKLIRKIQDEHFFSWEEKDMVCVDYPEAHITATLNGQHKHLLEGCNAPGQVLRLANEIDRVAGSDRWVGKKRIPGEQTVKDRCEKLPSFPPHRVDNQPIPEQLKIPDAPKTARGVSCFRSFNRDSTVVDVVRQCGIPDKHVGSGIFIFIYYMQDCSTVSVSTGNLRRPGITITHVKNGQPTILLK